jgi:hypothetical protein
MVADKSGKVVEDADDPERRAEGLDGAKSKGTRDSVVDIAAINF